MTRAPANIDIILLASGASSRMPGEDKLLKLIGGAPLLSRTAQACLASHARAVLVTIRPEDSARRAVLDTLPLQIVEAPDWRDGMAASIRAGVAALPADSDGVMLALGDMPDVTAQDINAVIAAFKSANGQDICRATAQDGTPGHPVLFSKSDYAALAQLTGDQGARAILAQNKDRTRLVPTKGTNALIDLDTPEAWATYLSED